jgi:arylsulfatase A-like enzyme
MKILVIEPVGFHLGFLGCYGNAWIDTPTLDALAVEGVVFDHHYSDCPTTVGAWRAWRTGSYGFPVLAGESPPAQEASDILSALQARGIPSVLVTDSPDSHPPNDGWQKVHRISNAKTKKPIAKDLFFESIHQLDSSEHGLIWVETNVLAPPWSVDESAQDYFSTDEENGEEPIEPLSHPVLGLLDPSDEMAFLRLQRTYAAATSRLDRELEELWEDLRQHNLYDSLMIIVTTDRGFPLGEHGLVGDGRPWLYEELVHTPLIVRMPRGAAAGSRIVALTQPVDLMLTLMDAFGLPSRGCHGSSLLPLIRGEQERIRDFTCSGLEVGGDVEYSVRTTDWTFLLPDHTGSGSLRPLRERQLYVKPDDRWEVNNVLQHHPEIAELLEQALRAFVKNPSQAHGWPSAGLESVNPNP